MKLKFLGSGAAFCMQPDNFQSNMLLTSKSGKNLLIDCGSDIRFSLAQEGLSYRDIDNIYISHLHADHVGGMEYMGFSAMFDPQCSKPGLYICESIRDKLWENTLSGGMKIVSEKNCTLSDYFTVCSIPDEGRFSWEGIEFDIVSTDHVVGRESCMKSNGLFFSIGNKTVLLTTDTVFNPGKLGKYMEQANLVLHDCETSSDTSGVHTRYEELLTLPEAIRKKIWLYHYDNGLQHDAVADGFSGFVKRGQVFEFPE